MQAAVLSSRRYQLAGGSRLEASWPLPRNPFIRPSNSLQLFPSSVVLAESSGKEFFPLDRNYSVCIRSIQVPPLVTHSSGWSQLEISLCGRREVGGRRKAGGGRLVAGPWDILRLLDPLVGPKLAHYSS